LYKISTGLQVCRSGTGQQEYYSGTGVVVGQGYRCTGEVYVFRAKVVLQGYTVAGIVQGYSDTVLVQVYNGYRRSRGVQDLKSSRRQYRCTDVVQWHWVNRATCVESGYSGTGVV
jgi:hypothetical protein